MPRPADGGSPCPEWCNGYGSDREHWGEHLGKAVQTLATGQRRPNSPSPVQAFRVYPTSTDTQGGSLILATVVVGEDEDTDSVEVDLEQARAIVEVMQGFITLLS